jgi:hypothetical protein
MARRVTRPIVGLIAAVAMSIAAPALALAHRKANAELLEHASDTRHSAPSHDALSVNVDEQHHGHAHPSLDRGLCSRCSGLFAIALALPATADPVSFGDQKPAEPPTPNESPPNGADHTPTRSRAPPSPLTI